MEWKINSDLCAMNPLCFKCSIIAPQIFDTSGETATIIRQPADKIEVAKCEEARQICLCKAIYTWTEPPVDPVIDQSQDTPSTNI